VVARASLSDVWVYSLVSPPSVAFAPAPSSFSPCPDLLDFVLDVCPFAPEVRLSPYSLLSWDLFDSAPPTSVSAVPLGPSFSVFVVVVCPLPPYRWWLG
jgi:hypothetical protein